MLRDISILTNASTMAGPQVNGSSEDLERGEEDHWIQLAKRTWSKGTKTKKITKDFISKELWTPLDSNGFDLRDLVQLENLQLLEYLWHGYSDACTNNHVFLIAFLVTAKSRQNLAAWDLFANDPERFTSFFRRVLSLSLDKSLSAVVRTQILSFLITAFQSLDNSLVRKECAPLVSISIWQNLNTEASRERKFEENPQLKKAWRASEKRFELADEEHQARLRFERAWLYTLVLDFITHLHKSSRGTQALRCLCRNTR